MRIKPWLDAQWQTVLTAQNQQELLQQLVKTIEQLGFDYCSFVLRAPYPLTAPKTMIMTNYPVAWQQVYHDNQYLKLDPIVQHCLRSTATLAWSGESTSPFWEEALTQGIRHGWAQAYSNKQNFAGMLSLARSVEPISVNELAEKELMLCWMTQIAYAGFYPLMAPKLMMTLEVTLTEREKEILRWTADGKSAEQIATILVISERAVHFHVTHILDKLGAANKTAATVQAVLLGLI